MKTFRGGARLTDEKHRTSGKPVEKAKEPVRVIIPLIQHIGAPNDPLVKEGDIVKEGQKIGDAKGLISAPVHSSIAGRVTAVEPRPHPAGMKVNSVVIENSGETGTQRVIDPVEDVSTLAPEKIISAVREAGIVGMGGAAFPTHVKLAPVKDKKADSFIVNGAECEPYLTSDERLMVERSGNIIKGMKIMMRALGVNNGYVAIEDNKREALRAMEEAAKPAGIPVVKLRTKYPQGAERQLVYSVLGRKIGAGELPISAAVIVNNVGTCSAVADLFRTGMPLISRVVTVTGSGVKEPKNLEVKIGTTFADVIEQCGGLSPDAEKIVMGGPMMGIAQYTPDVPVIKGCSGILVLTEKETDKYPPAACIRCGRCIDACPTGLSPALIGVLSEKNKWDMPEILDAIDCIECGVCAYVCPSKRPLVQLAKQAKVEIQKRKK